MVEHGTARGLNKIQDGGQRASHCYWTSDNTNIVSARFVKRSVHLTSHAS